ncbi:MAG: HAD family hydrolase [Acidimicrobiia bacterium]
MSLPRPPRAVTFDCWLTLMQDTDAGRSHRARSEMFAALVARHSVDLVSEKAEELIRSSWDVHLENWRKGIPFGSAGAARWCLDRVGVECTDELIEELATAFQTATPSIGTTPVDGAIAALELVRERGLPTALISDTGFTPGTLVKKMLNEHGIFLDHYFFSDEVGVPKPYPGIFSAAISAAGVPAETMVHIGDLRRTDVAGARAAGMGTIRFAGVNDDGAGLEGPDDPDLPEADAIIKDWNDLELTLGL